MNFLTLKQRVLNKLNESSSAPQFWSLTDIGDFINEAYTDITSGVKLLEKSTTLSTVANQMIYSLASDCLEITRMYYETNDHLINPMSFDDLIKIDNWFSNTTDTYPYYRIHNVGTQKALLYPKVNTSESTCITYWYKYFPSDMSDDDTSPSMPKTFHDALIDYACFVALLRGRSSQGKAKAKLFLDSYSEKKSRLEALTLNQVNRIQQLGAWG